MKENLYFKTRELIETWTKTMDLRWSVIERERLSCSASFIGEVVPYKENALQQKHTSNLGNEKWVNIESVVL